MNYLMNASSSRLQKKRFKKWENCKLMDFHAIIFPRFCPHKPLFLWGRDHGIFFYIFKVGTLNSWEQMLKMLPRLSLWNSRDYLRHAPGNRNTWLWSHHIAYKGTTTKPILKLNQQRITTHRWLLYRHLLNRDQRHHSPNHHLLRLM
jgi:hypothetical protein